MTMRLAIIATSTPVHGNYFNHSHVYAYGDYGDYGDYDHGYIYASTQRLRPLRS